MGVDSPYSSLVMENQEMNRIYNDPFGSSYVDMAPSLLSYGKSSNQIAQPCIPHKEIEVAEVVAASHISKRAKTETEPNPSVNQKKANASGENLDIVREQNLKTTEKDLKNSTSLLCTQLAEENTYNRNVQSEDSPKEGYVLRARKGQATKGHSLAERLRREKISERMKLLQELVPGCNKITGKAVMLDEIINYVQSLQQQVQFLSMKLATVTPELNYDIQTILSKDIFHSRNGSAPLGGFGLGTNPSHPYGIFQGIPAPNHQFLPFPRALLDNELQGCSKPDQ